jgi:hypothetical protein
MKNKPQEREFLPNIDTANEEIYRLDCRIAELEEQLAAKPEPTAEPPPAPAQTKAADPFVVGSTPLTGIQRSIAARNLELERKASK